MLIAAQETSIDVFHSPVRQKRTEQQREFIVGFISAVGADWSIGELAHTFKGKTIAVDLGLDQKSTVSARLNELLYEQKALIEKPKRKDRISGVTVRPVGLPVRGQGRLF